MKQLLSPRIWEGSKSLPNNLESIILQQKKQKKVENNEDFHQFSIAATMTQVHTINSSEKRHKKKTTKNLSSIIDFCFCGSTI